MIEHYIKREDAVRNIEKIVDTMSVCLNRDEYNGMRRMKKLCIDALLQTQAVDVRENVHGEWLHQEYDWAGDYLECSNCHEEYCVIDGDMDTDFCPSCGADMRK